MPFNYERLLSRLLNRPLLVTPQRAQSLLGVLAPRAGLKGQLVRADEGDGQAPVMLADLDAGRFDRDGHEHKVFDEVEGVAVIPVVGTLVAKLGSLDPWCGMTGYDGLLVKLREAAADPAVRGILLDVESPGGEVHSSLEELALAIHSARAAKPVWAVMSDYGYSAAYWLASQADRVVLPPTGGAGSVGVVCLHADVSRMLDEAGITVTLIHAGAHKVDGNPYQPLPEAVRDEIAAECEAIRTRFAAEVSRGRGLDPALVTATEARCYMGQAAVAAGLADQVMTPEEAFLAFLDELSGPDARTGADAAAQTANARETADMAPRSQAATMAAHAANARRRAEEEEEDEKKGRAEDVPPEDEEEKAEDEKKKEKEEKKAVASDRARIKAIIDAPAARGREALARHLALDTDMTAEQAAKALAAAPKASGLAEAMGKIGNEELGIGGTPASAADGWAASRARVFGANS